MGRNAGRVLVAVALGGAFVFTSRPAAAQGIGGGSGAVAGMPGSPGMIPGAASGGASTSNAFANPFTNPYMNPYLNPWMTQYPNSGNGANTLLYFMAAQRAAGGLGSPYAPGGSLSTLGGAAGNAGAAGGFGMGMPGAAGAGGGAGPGGGSMPGAGGGSMQGAGAPGGMRSGSGAFSNGGGLGPQRGQALGPRGRMNGPAANALPRPVQGAAANVRGGTRPGAGYVAGRFDDNPYVDDARGLLSTRYAAYGASMLTQEGQRMVPGAAPAPNEGVKRYFNRYPSYNR